MVSENIVGIDLGTTNSEIAIYHEGKIEILASNAKKMLPSCVGLSPQGNLLVGEPARNQALMYPDRTICSVKRQMGSNNTIALGDKKLTPQEVSALILRELVEWTKNRVGEKPQKAVITVPAYFSDIQRQATREAGELAGLEVVRILNEPTAASLAYGHEHKQETLMVYDLGGGTFDVSIVRVEGDIIEVLASHGNNSLGGDDFTKLLAEHLVEIFHDKHKIDLHEGNNTVYARLWWAAETAKQKLTMSPYVQVREENLMMDEGKPLHLSVEISRTEYENMISPLIESTMESVTVALEDSNIASKDLDSILLVGGSTRTPLVHSMLSQRSGLVPRQDLHPDLCVALGAGVMATRLSGKEVHQVLVDITPYSFGVSYLDEKNGMPYPFCYRPIIHKNTALPVTRTEQYLTSYDYQKEVDVNIFQGDDPDAMRNILVGHFRIEGLTPVKGPNEILCEMKLDLNGILNVSAIEKRTKNSKSITIDGAIEQKSKEQLSALQKNLESLFMNRLEDTSEMVTNEIPHYEQDSQESLQITDIALSDKKQKSQKYKKRKISSQWEETTEKAEALMERSRDKLDHMHADDKEEAIELHVQIKEALEKENMDSLESAMNELRELLYFVEGK